MKRKTIAHKRRKPPAQRGKGILKKIKKRVKAVFSKPLQSSTSQSSRLAKLLKDVGNVPIQAIGVGRTPVNKIVQGVLQLLSLGKYEEVKKKLKYDDVYHVFLIIQMRSGQRFKLEKNHVVECTKTTQGLPPGGLSFSSPLTLRLLLERAATGPSFWSYNPATNNCQNFVRDIVSSNHLIPQNQEALACLTPQQGDLLLKTLPGFTRWIPSAVTSAAAQGDRILEGNDPDNPDNDD